MTELSFEFLIFVVDVSIKSVLIGGIAWIAIALVSNANLRHRIATTALLGMLLMPLLVCLSPKIPLPISIERFESSLARNEIVPPTESDLAKPLYSNNNLNRPADMRSVNEWAEGIDSPIHSASSSRLPFDKNAPTLHASPSKHATSSSSETASEFSTDKNGNATTAALTESKFASSKIKQAPLQSFYAPLVHWIPLALATGYFIFAAIFLLRLTCGLFSVYQLGRRAKLVFEKQVGSFTARVKASDEIRVPMMTGFLRPNILLPSEWDSWSKEKTEAVIAHESAHIRRSDWLVRAASEFNLAIHWFNPMAWVLRKFLAESAEKCCDDAVIRQTGNRSAYARHLLDVATQVQTTSRFKRNHLALTMAKEPGVATRINSILNSDRTLSKRLGIAEIGILSCLAVITVSFASALALQSSTPTTYQDSEAGRIANAPIVDQRKKQSGNETNTATQESKTNKAITNVEPKANFNFELDAEDDQYEYEGIVLDEKDRPVVGADIYFFTQDIRKERIKSRLFGIPSDESGPIAKTDANGKFQFQCNASDFPPVNLGHLAGFAQFVAVVPGNIAWANSFGFEKSGTAIRRASRGSAEAARLLAQFKANKSKFGTIRFREPGKPIRGRLVDQKGNGLAGITILPFAITRITTNTMEEFKTLENFDSNNRISTPQLAKIIPPVQTNMDGWFEFSGFGKHSQLSLMVLGEDVVAKSILFHNFDSATAYHRSATAKIKLIVDPNNKTIHPFEVGQKATVTVHLVKSKGSGEVERIQAVGVAAGVEISNIEHFKNRSELTISGRYSQILAIQKAHKISPYCFNLFPFKTEHEATLEEFGKSIKEVLADDPTLETHDAPGVWGIGSKGAKVDQPTRESLKNIGVAFEINPKYDSSITYGIGGEITTQPSNALIGTVRDDNGAPVPGVLIYSRPHFHPNLARKNSDGTRFEIGNQFARALSNEKGEYRLTGLPITDSNPIYIQPPSDLPLIFSSQIVDTSGGGDSKLDAKLQRGKFIVASTIDTTTGKAVPGSYYKFLYSDGTKIPDVPNWMWQPMLLPDQEFKTRLVVPDCDGQISLIDTDGDFERMPEHTVPEGLRAGTNFAVKNYSFGDKNEIEIKFELASLPQIKIRLLDEKGNDISDDATDRVTSPVLVHNLRTPSRGEAYWERLEKDGTIRGFDGKQPRQLVFVHTKKKLAGSVKLKSDGKPIITAEVTLRPWGTIKGRLLNDDIPVANRKLRFAPLSTKIVPEKRGPTPTAPAGFTVLRNVEQKSLPYPGYVNHYLFFGDKESQKMFSTETKSDGSFEVVGLVPGSPYALETFGPPELKYTVKVPGKGTEDRFRKSTVRINQSPVMLKPGEVKDVGDIKIPKVEMQVR